MAKFVSVFISTTYRRLIAALVWVLIFTGILAVVGGYALHRVAAVAHEEALHATEQFTRLRTNLLDTFDLMHAQLTAQPCSPAFAEQLRRIAYLPDGLNEFLYAPGGRAECSINVAAFEEPVDLGKPDVETQGRHGIALWIDRDLSFLGLAGEKGTFALSEPFVAVVPPQRIDLRPPEWLTMEAVLLAGDGTWFQRAGEAGVYQRWLDGPGFAGLGTGQVRTFACDPGGVHCIAAEADLLTLMRSVNVAIALVLFAAGLIATWGADRILRAIARHWSFEARFCRHLDASSIVCAYQPVMHLDSGEIIGCEVLVRWRDVNDSIVFPDRFIDIVKRRDLTMQLTRLVARHAFEELSRAVPEGTRLQVNFNVFPQDLDCARLAHAFSGFTAQPDRFDVVLEIIESDEIPANAQREIEALRRGGIKTYIDDFGTGYSNMQNLAALSVDGVKLDRAFAMAPDNSMMAQMLRHAIEMIQATGRVMVVEGVETAERLALLRDMQARIDFVQGYFIARPLDIDAFVAFLAANETPGAGHRGARGRTAPLRDRMQGGKIAV